ncbi:MAG: hypothetical protein K1X78_06260 [Verrucomicrobiaceae bacterium]|nr:hypothetical protein [Verrucomicrobiaceae bacterium]
MKPLRLLSICTFLSLRLLAENPNTPADFTIDTTVVAPNPDRYGVNNAINGFADFNNKVVDPGFEPFVIRKKGTANGGGADYLVNSSTSGPTTSVYDILADEFFKDASIRVYRPNASNQMTLVRTGTVEHYYSGFNRIINNRLTSTTFRDGGLVAGRTYYYVVRAYDSSGNQSQNSTSVSAVALAGNGVAEVITGTVAQSITDQVAPASPTGLSATANADGTITLTWNANSETDLYGYWVFRSETDPALHNRIYINGPGAALASGDIYFLEMNPVNVPMDKVSPRVRSFFGGNDSWREVGNGATKLRDASTKAPENGGRTSMKLSASSANEVSVRQFRLGAPDSFYGSLAPSTTYRAEVWLKQQNVASGSVTFRLTGPYSSIAHTWTGVTGAWQKFTYEFTTSATYPVQNQGTAEIVLAFTGPGDVWMDNFYLYDPTQPTFAPRAAAVQQLADYMPGWYRTDAGQTDSNWGSSMEDWTNDDSLAQNQFNTFGGRSRPEQPYHLPYALQRAKDGGANPWLIVGNYFNEQEWLNLIEYLAGPAGTPYGDKRIAQRGIATPWTDEFQRIRFEYGNELWNPTFEWGLSGTQSGQFGEYFFNIARQSPYFAAIASKVDFTLNGQFVSAATNGYAASAMQVPAAAGAPGRLANSADLAFYIGGWDANIIIGGGIVAPSGFADYLMYSATYGKYWFDQQAQMRDTINAQGRIFKLCNYEAGPGYGLPSGNLPYNPVSEAYGKSLAAGVATLDCFLYGTYKRIDPQCYFTHQMGTNWASHSYLHQGNYPYASWLALRMRNRYVSGDMIATSINTVPTHDQPAWINSTNGGIAAPAAPNTPFVSCYAFRDGSKYSVFVLSRKYSGDTPVTLRLPFNSITSGTLYKLTGTPEDRNDQGTYVTQEQQQAVNNFAQTYAFTLPASSAYLFVFHGATIVAESNPTCTITQALAQADPTSTQSISFSVHFSQPITGFTASDVIIGGTAGATTATVTEIAPNLGTDFQVDVVGMTNSGTVTINVLANAAFNASSQGNLAASIIDNSVQFNMAPFVAYDDFNLTPPNPPFLNGITTGAGFAAAWQLTNFNAATYGDGYKLATTTPLSYLNLRRTGSYIAGGKNFDVAARLLDVDTTFAFYKVGGSSPSLIGRSGTTLWVSAMFRKDTGDTNRLLLFTLPSTSNVSMGGSNLGIGYGGDGTPALNNGTRYWSLQVRNATNNGFDYVRTNVPIITGQTALLVLKCSFGATDRFDLFVNPASLGSTAPAIADATWTTTGATDISFLMLGYSGGTSGVSQSSIDELRFGQTFADVTPTFTPSESWRLNHFGSAANNGNASDLADPDGDGIPNLLEYALNSLPNSNASRATPLPATTSVSGQDYLTLNVPWNTTAIDVTFIVEVSDDLTTWHSGPAYTTVVSAGANLVVRDNTPIGGASKRFIRLAVTH